MGSCQVGYIPARRHNETPVRAVAGISAETQPVEFFAREGIPNEADPISAAGGYEIPIRAIRCRPELISVSDQDQRSVRGGAALNRQIGRFHHFQELAQEDILCGR